MRRGLPGTVVTGTLIGGTVAVGEEVAILPGGKVAKVRGLQVHGGPVQRASAGTRTAVNLQGVEKENAPRASVLCHPGTLSPTKSAEAFVEYLPLVPKPLRNRAQVSFHAGTFSCVGRILLYGQAEIPPGGEGYGRVLLSEETVLTGGDRFILRGFSPLANFGYTIGGGTVVHPKPPARKGAGKAVPEALPRLRSEDGVERAVLGPSSISGAGRWEASPIMKFSVRTIALFPAATVVLFAGLRQDTQRPPTFPQSHAPGVAGSVRYAANRFLRR